MLLCGFLLILDSFVLTAEDVELIPSYLKFQWTIGVPTGDKYLWLNYLLPIAYTGDGGPVSNVLKNVTHLVLTFLHILGLGGNISQSIYCGACVLISSLSESSEELTPLIQQVGSTIKKKGQVSVYCNATKGWVCIEYKRVNIADWKFAFTHFNLSVGVTGKYSMIELVMWRNGKAYGVSKEMYYECLMSDYYDPWTIPCYDDCVTSAFTGLALSDKDVLYHWGIDVDSEINMRKSNDNSDQWQDLKYERQERMKIAQNDENGHIGHGILRAMTPRIDPALADVAHGFWSFIGMFCYIVICAINHVT